MTSLDILESPYCVDTSVQSSNDSNLPLASSRLPLPTQVISSPSCPPPLSYYENNPKAKDELIQKATARLRCRLLQEGLTDVQSKVSQLRSQLDDLRLELITTEKVLDKVGEPDDRQLRALERRFNTHQQELDHVLSNSMLIPMPTTPPTPTASTEKSILSTKALTTSTSFTSTLSRMSSIFSSSRHQKSTKKRVDPVQVPPVPPFILNDYQYSEYSSTISSSSTSEEDSNNDMATPSVQQAREKRIRRRQRVKQLRREYLQRLRFYDPSWNEDGDWQSARSPSAPSVDNHPLPLQSTLPPTPPPQQEEEEEQQQQPHSAQQPSHKIQSQQEITVSPPTNETTTTTTITTTKLLPTTEKKRRPYKESATTSSPAKKTVTTSIAPMQPKSAQAQCLCKRKSTNKPGPVRHHKAASTTSQTYHSKQPEWISLKTPEKQSPPSPSPNQTPVYHSIAIPTDDNHNHNNDISPPSQFNVSGWLLDQQKLHLQQQQQQHDNNDGNDASMDSPYAETMDSYATYHQHGSSTPPNTSRNERNGDNQQQHQQALDLFDDVLRYLDTFSDFGSDTGLQQDISLLLSSPFNNHQDDDLQSTTSRSSLSSYWSHYHQLAPHSSSSFYQQIQLYTLLVNHGMATFSQYIVESVSKGVSWCKFLSVLSLACLISLGRGPEHMLLSLDDLDYLDLLCGQDEFDVDSYYL